MTRPSQQRAKNKYDAVHYTVVGCKIRKEDAEAFKEACKMRETSPNAIFREAMNRFMSGDHENAPVVPAAVSEEYCNLIEEQAKLNNMSVDDFVKNAIIEKISRRDDELINMAAKVVEMWFTAHKDEIPEGAMEDCLTYFRQYVR